MGKMAAAFVTLALLMSCAYARQLLDAPPAPPVDCLIGAAGDKACGGGIETVAAGGYYTGCVPLAARYPDSGYNATAGSCGRLLIGPQNGPALQFTFLDFAYTPPDNTWGGAAQKAFVSKEKCDNEASNSAIKCSNTYQKATATTTTTTFTQSLALEADFTFKVGGCALCPAEADTTFKITASGSVLNTSTTTFSSSLEADVPAGACVVDIFSVNYLSNFEAAFVANVDATCMQSGALRTEDNTYFAFPCTDIEGFLKSKKDFTATILSVDPYSKNQKAHISLAGAQLISFGTVVNKAACDCNDTKCIAANEAAQAGGGVNAVQSVSVNPTALPKGAPSGVGTAKPLTSAQTTCTDCITNKSGGSGTASKVAPATAPAKAG